MDSMIIESSVSKKLISSLLTRYVRKKTGIKGIKVDLELFRLKFNGESGIFTATIYGEFTQNDILRLMKGAIDENESE